MCSQYVNWAVTPASMTEEEWQESLAKVAWASARDECGLRYHVPLIEFDARSAAASNVPSEDWSDEARARHARDVEKLKSEIQRDYGIYDVDQKYLNFVDIGSLPLSISTHHNELFNQARHAFVAGLYYAALTSACSLGERMLNHMVLDTKASWQDQFPDKDLRDGRPIQSWNRMIHFLEKGGILVPKAKQAFERLHGLRNRSVHFNLKTITRQRNDAQSALQLLRNIAESQYACFGFDCPWIDFDGFRFFVKKEHEQHPFVKAYYHRVCPRIGPRYDYRRVGNLWVVTEHRMLDDGSLSDAQFIEIRKAHNNSRVPVTDDNAFTSAEQMSYTWMDKQYFIVVRVVDTDKGAALQLVDPLYGTPGHRNQESAIAYYHPQVSM